VCPGSQISAGEQFSVSFNVTNPSDSQESPVVTISAAGSVTITASAMSKPAYTGEPVHGVSAVTDVMLIVVPELSTKKIGQSSPFSEMENILTVTLQSGFALSPVYDSSVTISGLAGAVVAGDKVQLSAVSNGNEGQFLWCSAGGERGYGTWRDAAKALVLVVCSDKTMEAGQTYVFAFSVKNPEDGQLSPDVQIEAFDTERPVSRTSITKDYLSVIEDIPGGSEVMWVLFRDFTTTSIGQTSPVASRANQIRITLSASLEFRCQTLHSTPYTFVPKS
jgi:hypothetical protein